MWSSLLFVQNVSFLLCSLLSFCLPPTPFSFFFFLVGEGGLGGFFLFIHLFHLTYMWTPQQVTPTSMTTGTKMHAKQNASDKSTNTCTSTDQFWWPFSFFFFFFPHTRTVFRDQWHPLTPGPIIATDALHKATTKPYTYWYPQTKKFIIMTKMGKVYRHFSKLKNVPDNSQSQPRMTTSYTAVKGDMKQSSITCPRDGNWIKYTLTAGVNGDMK